ncbi:NADP-dependent aldehyde dehydrogenase [Actinopolyspora saharensis]|uniref:NADP-dependent aldehyde dehydrogenase n=2 Tax=Actinopolyspora saharensis TaxID=995062 RepID=A0A1H1DZ38_9ACTN|nr:aldehyde dehydrogenase (NADP(+)) [Actinopolyspora saharensis]SDQ81529.1 NADP-dependent aldehyde dehydrogenase [Actinopolyspora saharensis]
MSEPTGSMLIAGEAVRGQGKRLRAVDPSTGGELAPEFGDGAGAEVRRACQAAEEAFEDYRALPAERRAVFLETVADNIEAIGEPLIERAHAETGLPKARVTGERARTTGQLRLFAEVVREGSHSGARIDPARSGQDLPARPDIRQRRVALGPVAVFGASNFPLAFSVAGGDTASALAAGCPVVVKGHEAHPGTSELVGRAVTDAVASCGLPAGTFSLLFGADPALGGELVADPAIRAVGFTGSRKAGMALRSIALNREHPVPVYAEMSSVNPVFPLEGALADDAEGLGERFVGSLTLGSGQFCTNPGLVVGAEGDGMTAFLEVAERAVAGTDPTTMLTPAIAAEYERGVTELAERDGVSLLARGRTSEAPNTCRPALLVTDAETFLADAAFLQREVFGACSLVVRCPDRERVREVARALEGQLTATVHANREDHEAAAELLPLLERTAGRVLFNGWPTGVEVGHAMVHGGPYPATTDPRSTSVGTAAIERFLRPVAYQDVPAELLPGAVSESNPDGIWRRVDGELAKD